MKTWNKKYVIWIDYGHDGWAPDEFDSLEECVDYARQMCAREYTITTPVKIEIKEVVSIKL
jgi:hypothetical protein